MGFLIRPLRLFAERRPETLERTPNITAPKDDGKSNLNLCLETKYGLRLHVFPNGPIRISSIRLRKRLHEESNKRLHEEMVHDDVDDCNSILQMMGAASPLGPISYRIFPSWCTSYLWETFKVTPATPDQVLFRMGGYI
jgi:hypothetical protein